MTGSRLLLQPLNTVAVERDGFTIYAPDYSVPGVAERVEREMRQHEAAQLTNPTLAELSAFNRRWP